MIDHLGIDVSDYKKSKAFYEKALKPLGIKLLHEFGGTWAGFGKGDKAFLWIIGGRSQTKHCHIAMGADKRAQVDAFYDAAIGAGGKDNGKPGIRKDYHPNYYGAFVFDPDGNNVEAVCHNPVK